MGDAKTTVHTTTSARNYMYIYSVSPGYPARKKVFEITRPEPQS
jgi:hypothetical protein